MDSLKPLLSPVGGCYDHMLCNGYPCRFGPQPNYINTTYPIELTVEHDMPIPDIEEPTDYDTDEMPELEILEWQNQMVDAGHVVVIEE